MKRSALLILVFALVVVWAACSVHGERPFGEEPLGTSGHASGCTVLSGVLWFATTLPMLALTGRLGLPADARRQPAPPLFVFQPPD